MTATTVVSNIASHFRAENEGNMVNFDSKPSFASRIVQLLRNINSAELQLCIDGCKEFKKLLRGSFGGELLCEYVKLSSKFTELLDAWNRRKGKAGVSYVLSLITSILNHSEGRYDARNHDSVRVSISRVLDKFGRLITEEKMEDLYVEINSKDGKRQKAALLLLASVVRRGSLLANEVAKKFDFKMPMVGRLAEYRKNGVYTKRRYSTRGAFVEFAMSFLEVGKPGLVRSILQQREVFSGILRGLGNDDDVTAVYILSTLRDRVLTNESGIPPPLRSVLFGSVTLEQLVDISARGEDVLAAKIAYEVLYTVCIDPSNGLMPDLKRKPVPLKGNHKRLVDLMKKLRATDVEYHRRLLLEIVHGRAALASTYLDQFPYNLEDHTSPMWLSAVTLAAKVVSSVRDGIVWDFLSQQTDELLTFEDSNVQNVYKCVCISSFNRLAVNKGLLHSDPLIKHGTLRLVLEVLKLFNSFIDAISLNGLSSLKQKLRDEVRVSLPDSQVLFTLISSIGTSYQNSVSSRKRAHAENTSEHKAMVNKRQKIDNNLEDVDIVVGGVHSVDESVLFDDNEKIEEEVTVLPNGNEIDDSVLLEVWDSDESFLTLDVVNKDNVFFQCKVLEALKIYHRTLVDVLEVSYDVLKILPTDPLELPSILVQSLLSMLIEHFGCSTEYDLSRTMLPPIYKHLQSLLVLFLHSPIKDVRLKAYTLAKAALMSIGAFDHSSWEIGSWFLFLPGNIGPDDCCRYVESKSFQSLSTPVVSFLCDAVSTVGNNLVKYWEILKCQHSILKAGKVKNVDVSPLIICILEKCLRLLGSGSGTFTLPEKSLISVYVCNTLKYLLQTQIEPGSLAGVIHQLLSERFGNQHFAIVDAESNFCEWRPLISLMHFSRSVQCQETCDSCSTGRVPRAGDKSFADTFAEVNSLLTAGNIEGFEMFKAVYFTIICSAPDDLLRHLPAVMTLSGEMRGFHHYVMNYYGLDHSVMNRISKLWPDMFCAGLELSLSSSVDMPGVNRKQTTISNWCANPETIEYGSVIFGSFLKEAPFHMLFPALIFCDKESSSKIKEVLVAKILNLTTEHFIPSLRLVLFWLHQVHLSYRKNPSKQHEWRSEVCYLLMEHILGLLSSKKVDCPLLVSSEVAKAVFAHPAVMSALQYPFRNNYELTEEIIKDCSEGLSDHCLGKICKTELHAVKLLTRTCEYLLALPNWENSSSLYTDCKENIKKSFKNLVQRLFLIFKERFTLWHDSQNVTLLPILCAVIDLMRFMSPLDLLELANWIITRVELSNFMLFEPTNVSPICLAFAMASAAFDMLSQFVQTLDMKVVVRNLFWAVNVKGVDASLFRSIYLTAIHSATVSKVDLADTCLVKALSVARRLSGRQELLSFSMEITRVIACTPTEIVSHCVYGTNSTKAKLLSLLIELSPLHSSVFGCLVSEILGKGNVQKVNLDHERLLPAAISYINSSRMKLKAQSPRNTESIATFYSRLLIDGFSNWKDFVSKAVFKVEYGDFVPCSAEDLHGLFLSSFLGKTISVLCSYFASIEDSTNKKLELFSLICPSNGALGSFLDFDVGNINSVEELLNLTNAAAAKISFCLMLLFPEDCDKSSSSHLNDANRKTVSISCNAESLRRRFLDSLVGVWQQIVKKLPNNLDQKSSVSLLLKSLEVFILRCIYTSISKMRNVLIQMHPLPYVVEITKGALLYRFGDPTTLESLRWILLSLSDGELPVALILQLLLGHSQLSSVLTSVGGSSVVVSGIAVKPISTFLRALVIPTEKDPSEPESHKSQLQIMKLLRLLFHLRARQEGPLSEDDLGVNLSELVLLLLSLYRATVSEIDVEIYRVLSEIESAVGMGDKKIAKLDYLWGKSLSITKENLMGPNVTNDVGDAELEQRRSQFRDNLPIDTKLLIDTIVHFPYNGTADEKTLLFDNSHRHLKYDIEGNMKIGRFELYDPSFILSLSIHSLSMGYLDPVEFVSLGLLAVALVSIASVVDGIRKLGYEVLGRFSDALKSSQKKREVTRLKLLLTYLQNGVEEPWQRFPTISAMFVAEASVVLLDPSHEQFLAISKFLAHTPRIDVKKIPFLHDVFGTGSVKYRTDRLWFLRLLYAGINHEDDASIFIRNAVPKILLSDYTSSTSDFESKDLILQVLKKCVKEQTMAHHLIENCCLISWLSSDLALSMNVTNDEDLFVSRKFIHILEIVEEIVSSENTMESLQMHGFQQLSDLSYRLLNLLVTRSKLVRKDVTSVTIILKVIVAALKISRKRNIDLPQFTLSMRSLYQLYEAVDAVDSDNSGQCAELGLKAILMSTPRTNFDLSLEELSKLLVWAVSTALLSDSRQAKRLADHSPCFTMSAEKLVLEDSITSTLLHWLVASVILQRASCRPGDSGQSFVSISGKGETLLSLMECLNRADGARNLDSGFKGIIAANILHLLQHKGMNSTMLPSAVAALSILLSDRSEISVGGESSNPSSISSLMSKIAYPLEADPAWKWSYQQPWADQTDSDTGADRINELHACQLLVIVLEIMENKSLDFSLLSAGELGSPT
ncbi:hypothetical protein vseg_007290 [Gypsophila vaccaria]